MACMQAIKKQEGNDKRDTIAAVRLSLSDTFEKE
jgi:hypothetical protein